ncbi:MAG TPA: bifunctional GNAT family N-acetyltransferase/carbon-nitrogen hydrolase family protein [Balneolales bacterium]|nr:bifunctional GNAT family N-acetyltransferase/carbon-nitrogen hydrolase family protein [Balneolales bacterium]
MGIENHHKSIESRALTLPDFEAVTDLQERCFPGMKTWTIGQFKSQLENFPEGQIGIFYDGKLISSSSSLIVDIDEYADNHTWEEVTDNGYIRNHDPGADTLYGMEVMVDAEFRNMKIGRRMYELRKELCAKLNLRRILVGGRLPFYHKFKDEYTVFEYIRAVNEKKIFDPVLTFQLKNGFVIKRIMKDYLREDKESCGYATLLEWVNLEYRQTAPKRKVTSHPVRICCVQYQMRKITGFKDFAQQVEYFVDVASDYKSDFVLFPELLTTQLLSFQEEKRPGLAARELTKFTDEYLELFNTMSIRYNVNIIGGSHFALEDDKVYNISYLFRRDGTIERQYKLHITPSERRWWGIQPGNKLNVFDTDRGRIAILICYDAEFPEMARLAVAKGAQILFIPYCTDERHGFTRLRICAQARAIENQVYTAIAGTVGNIPSVENMDIQYAQSAIFTPSDFPFSRDGVASISEANTEMVVIADVDLELLRRARHFGTVTPLKDRRTDLYEINYKNEEFESDKPITVNNIRIDRG